MEKSIKTKKKTVKKKRVVQKKEKPKSDLYIAIGSILAIVVLAIFIINIDKIFPAPELNTSTSDSNMTVYAKVNGVEITSKQIENRYASIADEYKSQISKSIVINQTIYELLFQDELEKKGIIISDVEVDTLIDQRIQQTIDMLGQAQFEQMLLEQGTTIDEIKKQYWEAFKQEIVISKINEQFISEDDLKGFYDDNIEKFMVPEQINSSHILICFNGTVNCDSNLTEAKALQTINELKTRIDAGEDFGSIAKNYSICPSSIKEGNLGVTAKGQFVEAFDNAAFSMVADQVSEPVKTEFGWHLIKVHEYYPEELAEYEDVKEQIKMILLSQKQTEIQNYYQQLWDDADIEIYYSEPKPKDLSNCSKKYNVSKDTIIFFYSDTCPHCQKMKPVVEELESQGYSFKWANSADSQSIDLLSDCFQKQLNVGVPQFICAGTGEVLLGERPKDSLIAFLKTCI